MSPSRGYRILFAFLAQRISISGGQDSAAPRVQIETIVVNLGSDKNNWECMQHQLSDSPYSFRRHPGVRLLGLGENACDGIFHAASKDGKAMERMSSDPIEELKLAGSFCSFYKFCKKTSSEEDDGNPKHEKDVFILLQDTVGLRPQFFKMVTAFVEHFHQPWDIVHVDPGVVETDSPRYAKFWGIDVFRPFQDTAGPVKCLLLRRRATAELSRLAREEPVDALGRWLSHINREEAKKRTSLVALQMVMNVLDEGTCPQGQAKEL